MSIIKQDYGSFQDMATQHMLAPILQNLVNTTGAVIFAGSYFIFNNELYKATADIAANATIVIGTTSGCNANYAKTITEEMRAIPFKTFPVTVNSDYIENSNVYCYKYGRLVFFQGSFKTKAVPIPSQAILFSNLPASSTSMNCYTTTIGDPNVKAFKMYLLANNTNIIKDGSQTADDIGNVWRNILMTYYTND